MSNLIAVGGSRIFIGSKKSPKANVLLSDFTGELWIEIDGWTQAGALGDEQEVIEQSVINANRIRKMKGSLNGGTMENTFLPDGLDAGQIKFKSAILSCKPYSFKVEWGSGCFESGIVTMPMATPGLVLWTAHGLLADQPISFTSTGTLPAALTSGTIYYVKAPITADSFALAATPGGVALAFAAAGTGVITATAQESGMTDMFYGLAMPGKKQGGESNSPQLRSWSIAIDSNIVEV